MKLELFSGELCIIEVSTSSAQNSIVIVSVNRDKTIDSVAIRLVHHALLAIVVRILHGVDSVEQRGLASLGVNLGAAAGGTSGTGSGEAGGTTLALKLTLTLADTLASGLTASGAGASQAGAGSVRSGEAVTGGVRAGQTGTSGVRASKTGASGAGAGDTVGAVVVAVRASEASTGGVRATDGARLTLEAVVTLLAASENTTLLLKVGHADGRKSRGAVVLGSVVVNLVDGDSGVNDVRLNSLLVNDGLDGLVNVVVNVLATNGRLDTLSVTGLKLGALISKLRSLGGKALLHLGIVAVLEVTVLDSAKVVVVLLRENLTVLDGLDRGVVVVLVDLLVDSSLDLLVLVELVALVGNSRSDLFVDSGVVVTRAGP